MAPLFSKDNHNQFRIIIYSFYFFTKYTDYNIVRCWCCDVALFFCFCWAEFFLVELLWCFKTKNYIIYYCSCYASCLSVCVQCTPCVKKSFVSNCVHLKYTSIHFYIYVPFFVFITQRNSLWSAEQCST